MGLAAGEATSSSALSSWSSSLLDSSDPSLSSSDSSSDVESFSSASCFDLLLPPLSSFPRDDGDGACDVVGIDLE